MLTVGSVLKKLRKEPAQNKIHIQSKVCMGWAWISLLNVDFGLGLDQAWADLWTWAK